ncbi:pyridoxamine 5'-phosphate oxidase [Actinokineospora sp. G85]|uniref:pyridoxamine 5'-phosphate oxidase n=1 Tax=Actinokineospora sp. G85 TaxID=3406626 RepID=UPI003C761964
MMSFVMDEQERTAFLADVHIGVIAIERAGRGPLAVPIWYGYQPGGDVQVWMDRRSHKFKAISAAGRFSLVAQVETFPYKYVSVEGPVVSTEPPTREEALALAIRYVGEQRGTEYVDGALDDGAVLVRMRPEHWLSNDQGK